MSGDPIRHVRPGVGPGTLLEITPEDVGWRFLSFRVLASPRALGPSTHRDNDIDRRDTR